MLQVPILFIIFNRPDATRQVFESIKASKPARLYVAADGPRNGNTTDELNCNEARGVIDNIDWPCEIRKLYRNENLGCFKAVSEAIDWFFDEEEMGIILEDDCLAHQDFYMFCSKMLERFKDNDGVISINGSNLGYSLNNGDSYTFSRYMNMWGWATWRRSVKNIDYSLHLWNKKKHKLLFIYNWLKNDLFDFDINWYKYWREKFDLLALNDNAPTWDWQWIYSQMEYKQLSIVPAVNLVSNIGFNHNATHTHCADNPAANLAVDPLSFPMVHPSRITVDKYYEEEYVKKIWCYHKRLPASFYVKMYISKILSSPNKY